MVHVKLMDLHAEILQRVTRMEHTLDEGLREVRQKLTSGEETFQFFKDGLSAHKDRALKDTELSNAQTAINKWAEKIRRDKELRFPHRKILDALLQQYDFEKHNFNEIQFSKLVKEAHVGKNAAKAYLALLEQKGYVEKRDDGYRIFFKIRE